MLINKDTIISAFNDKITLLQWLKTLEKVLDNSILERVELITNDNKIKLKFYFRDGTTQETNEITLQKTDAVLLASLMEGSESIVVDLNEDATAVELHLDYEVMQKIERALMLPLATPTEQKLVGIDNTNTQNLLSVGDGLTIENGTIKAVGGGGGGTKLYKHNVKSSNITDKTFVIINVNATSLSGSNPAQFAGASFICGYVTDANETDTSSKFPFIAKIGASVYYFNNTTSSIESAVVNGTITDNIVEY